MKKLFIVVVILLALGSIAAGVIGILTTRFFSFGQTRGSGNMITRTIDAPDFHSIDASRAVNVVIVDDASGEITIEADDNIMEYVVVKAQNGELRVGLKNNVSGLGNYTVTVTVPDNGKIRELEASSAATITTETPLTVDKLELDASSAARIEVTATVTSGSAEASSAANIDAAIQAVNFEADASSAARITLRGATDKFDVEASSASRIHASEFVSATCHVEASSAANASVNSSKRLIVYSSSGASVDYTGECTDITLKKSSGGGISRN